MIDGDAAGGDDGDCDCDDHDTDFSSTRVGDDVVAGSESQVIDESTLLHGGAGAG